MKTKKGLDIPLDIIHKIGENMKKIDHYKRLDIEATFLLALLVHAFKNLKTNIYIPAHLLNKNTLASLWDLQMAGLLSMTFNHGAFLENLDFYPNSEMDFDFKIPAEDFKLSIFKEVPRYQFLKKTKIKSPEAALLGFFEPDPSIKIKTKEVGEEIENFLLKTAQNLA